MQELYDVIVRSQTRRPMALGFKTDGIYRTLSVEPAEKVVTKPDRAVQRSRETDDVENPSKNIPPRRTVFQTVRPDGKSGRQNTESFRSHGRHGLLNISPLGLVPVVPALLRYSNSLRICVAQKRGNHRDEPGGGLFQQARQTVGFAINHPRSGERVE